MKMLSSWFISTPTMLEYSDTDKILFIRPIYFGLKEWSDW